MMLTTEFLIMKLLENCVFCPNISWEDAKQNDLIKFINDSDAAELEKNLNIGKNIDDPTRDDIIQII